MIVNVTDPTITPEMVSQYPNGTTFRKVGKTEEPEPQYKIGSKWRSKCTGAIWYYKKYQKNTGDNLHHVLVEYFDDDDHEIFRCTRWCNENQLLEEFEPIDVHDINVVEIPEAVENKGDNTMKKHNDHYTKLADYEPFKVYEAWAKGNEELFKKNFTLGGYYLAALKYLARIESKDDPVKNLEKVAVYVQAMINILKKNHNLDEFIQFTDTISNLNPAEILAKLRSAKFRSMEEIVAEKGWVVETNEDGQRIITSPPTTQFPQFKKFSPDQPSSELNPYSLHKKPEVERLIEWSTTSFVGLPRRCVRKKDDTYRLNHDDEEGVVVWYWHEFADWGNWHYIDEPIKQEPEQTNEWHDWKDEDNQPEKGRWIEWDGHQYVADGYKRQTTVFKENNGNYTAYLWNEGRKSCLKGYWDWEEMKHWGQWRYVDEPKAQENV
jgi:hypothetical protein